MHHPTHKLSFNFCSFSFIDADDVSSPQLQSGVKRSVTRLHGGTLGYAEVIAIKVCVVNDDSFPM